MRLSAGMMVQPIRLLTWPQLMFLYPLCLHWFHRHCLEQWARLKSVSSILRLEEVHPPHWHSSLPKAALQSPAVAPLQAPAQRERLLPPRVVVGRGHQAALPPRLPGRAQSLLGCIVRIRRVLQHSKALVVTLTFTSRRAVISAL